MEETERITNFPKINSLLKLKVEIEQALLSVSRIDKEDSHSIILSMKNVIEMQALYIKMLEKQEQRTSKIPKAFENLQASLDKFSLTTRTGRKMLNHLESNKPIELNL